MATGNKFDLSSGGSDGPMYMNGPRGSFAATSFDRSSSYRETTENRILPSISSMQRSGTSLSVGDVVNFMHTLPVDARQLAADQKFPRQGEIKKMISSALGISQDESSTGTLNTKLIASSSQDEIKRVKAVVHDNLNKASSRVRGLVDVISAMDRVCQGGILRKRSRSDLSSSERPHPMGPSDRAVPVSAGNATKMASQSHLLSSGVEVGPQKSEDRSKHVVPNKRARTSMLDMDARPNNFARPAGSADREKDMFRLVNGGGAVQSEEKDRTLPTSVIDGWEKSKMRKKRSGIKPDVSASNSAMKAADEQEPKRGIQQRLANDGRSRVNATHGFRSGPVAGVAGVGKSDVNSQQNGFGIRSMSRSDQDGSSLLTDRRERVASLDKERLSFKASNKPSGREDNIAANPTSTSKITAPARGPRSSSVSVPKSSPTAPRPASTPEDNENTQSTNRLHSMAGLNNRKRSASSRSSSPPVTQWGGQRPQKINRVARRNNFVPLISTHEEAPPSDSTVTNGPATLSESEESGAAEIKTKDKSCKSFLEMDEKAVPTVQKATTLVLPSKKNKMSSDQFLGDGVRRQGRTGRGFTSLRAGLPSATEKLDNTVTTKQMRSARLCSDKIESKAGRPPQKKSSERKGYVRPRHALNGVSAEFPVESGDDHEELLAAANAVLNTSGTGNACPGSFWKQMEPLFRFVSAEDVSFLKQQICSADEFPAGIQGQFDVDQNLKGDLGCSLTASNSTVISRDYSGAITNGAKGGELEIDIKTDTLVPLSLKICAAIIDADEMEKLYCDVNEFGMGYELEAELKFNNLNQLTKEGFPVVGKAASNSHRVTASKRYHDELKNEEVVHVFQSDTNGEVSVNCNSSVNGLGHSASVCSEFQYAQMCLDDRILLELQSIGLSPELLPGLTQGEDEIGEEITRLEDKLHEQLTWKKNVLMNLEKAALEARELQEREFGRLALDKLVLMAYNKYMACWGTSSSGGKSSASKLVKHTVLSFAKRVLARCHTFEETGRSCFSEPVFKDLFYATSHCGEESLEVTAAHPSADAPCPAHLPGSKVLEAGQRGELLSEENYAKEDTSTSKVKRREVFINEVVGGASVQAHSGLGGMLSSGTKGKRSEREREGKARELVSRAGPASKVGRPAIGGAKGERKAKTKPKQKMTQLSASVNGMIGKASAPPKAGLPAASRSLEMNVGDPKERDDVVLLPEEAIDLSHLQLPGMDVLGVPEDLGDQGQDIGSWLNIEDDALLDDCMGLEIPMDDLSDLKMMV